MFTDKTPALNVSSSHPGAWFDLGRVINVPKSEGAVPSGHCFPRPWAVPVIQRSPLGMGGELGKCAGWGQAGLLPLPQEVPQGRQQGQRAGARVRASQLWAGTSPAPLWPQLFFYQCLLFPPPVKATLTIWDENEKIKCLLWRSLLWDDLKIPIRKKCLHIITQSSTFGWLNSLAENSHRNLSVCM